MDNTNNTKFIVQTAAACMPSSCWGRYGKVAVLEVDADRTEISMISERARGCHKVVQVWDKLHKGSGSERTAFGKALAEAQALAASLNEGGKVK